jgi:hypothetical protein
VSVCIGPVSAPLGLPFSQEFFSLFIFLQFLGAFFIFLLIPFFGEIGELELHLFPWLTELSLAGSRHGATTHHFT